MGKKITKEKTLPEAVADIARKHNYGSRGTPLITSPGEFPSRTKTKIDMKRGDWVRCNRGPLRGAEGNVDQLEKASEFVTIIEVKQLNGNIIRLPRSHWDFASYKPEIHAE